MSRHLNLKDKKLKVIFMLFSLLLSLTLLSLTLFTVTVSASPESSRIAGYTQYDTSASIAKEGWTQSDYAVLAYGENFPDALAAAPLAKKYNAPILLTEKQALTPVVKQTLQDLNVKNIFIVGGSAVVSANVENELKEMGLNVSRFAGNDQYDTAIEIAKQLGACRELSVVTGTDFADALSIASVSALKSAPIILVPKGYLPTSVKTYLSTNIILHSYIVGDSDLISNSVFSQFPNAERIAGDDKYARNIAVLNKFDSSYDFATVFMATGNGFADALSGTAYAAKISAPIVLVDKTLSSVTQEYMKSKLPSIKNLRILGGEAVIPNTLLSTILGNSSPISSSDSIIISNIDLNTEVATVTNTGSSDVDLTGWSLESEQGSQTYVFPSGTILRAGGSLRILSGPDAVAGIDTLVWTTSNIWNNSGDPGVLYDSKGNIVSSYNCNN